MLDKWARIRLTGSGIEREGRGHILMNKAQVTEGPIYEHTDQFTIH